MNVLEKASEITSHDRNIQYSPPEDNFQRIWEYNKAYLTNKAKDRNLTQEIECQLISFIESLGKEYVARQGLFIKLGRMDYRIHQDSIIDACGYLRCEAKIHGIDTVDN